MRQLGAAVLLVLIVGLLPRAGAAQSPDVYAVVEVSGITSGAPRVGDDFTTEIRLTLAAPAGPEESVAGIEIWIRFEPEVVTVVDANGSPADGTQVDVTNLLFGSTTVITANEVTDCPTGGRCIHVVLSPTGRPVTTETARVATVTWAGQAAGSAGLQILAPQTRVWDQAGRTTAIQGARVPTIRVVAVGDITGTVRRQGNRADGSGTRVMAINAGGDTVAETVTAGDGTFTLTVPAGSIYLVQAMYNGYLRSQKSNVAVADGGTVDIGTTTMLGGDVNADDSINILDMVSIINRFSTTGWSPPEPGDINDDLQLNIFDLTLGAGNFGRSGPVSW